jgi:phospholipid/cholesterol/gamma-HCH transport system permease protein
MQKPLAHASINAPAGLTWSSKDAVISASGDWDARGCGELAGSLSQQLAKHDPKQPWRMDAQGILRMDTAGALLMLQLREHIRTTGGELDLGSLQDYQTELIELIQRIGDLTPPQDPPALNPVAAIGKATLGILSNAYDTLVFIGEVITRLAPLLLRPWRLRWPEIINEIQAAGSRSVPIIALLSFLIGVVIAYQSGVTMEQYGATIFLADMIGIVTLREMAPLITAIVVAGRTGSSYAAAIGTMKITQEVDALRTLAISPIEMLVIPRVLALTVALPLLTVLAMAVGLYGGLLVAHQMFGLDLNVAYGRLEAMEHSNLWVGLIKTPVFALTIAMIGCHEGMKVRGSAAEVGRATTSSVVQAIFWVIVLNAGFSILFRTLDL